MATLMVLTILQQLHCHNYDQFVVAEEVGDFGWTNLLQIFHWIFGLKLDRNIIGIQLSHFWIRLDSFLEVERSIARG